MSTLATLPRMDGQAQQYVKGNDAFAATEVLHDGLVSVDLSSGDVTLSGAQLQTGIVRGFGILTANRNLIYPDGATGVRTILNDTSGAFTVTVKTVSGTGVVAASGVTRIVCDGTNVR